MSTMTALSIAARGITALGIAVLGTATLGLALASAAGDAQAARSASPTQAQAPEKRATFRRKPRIQHAPSPSEESPAQRDRRLARECQGLPNAGACVGYALPRR